MPPACEQHPHRFGALVVLCAAALIVNLDNTILNVALPTLVRDLRATSSQLQWIVDSYAMVFAGLLLVGGSLADRFGRKRIFLIGLAIFAGGSIGAARSSSVDLLVAFRAVMGVGALSLFPRRFPSSTTCSVTPRKGQRPSALGAGPSASASPSALSPEACCWPGSGGVRSSSVNVPIVIAAFIGAVLFVSELEESRCRTSRSRRCHPLDSRFGPSAVVHHRRSDPGLDLPRVILVGSASLVVLGSFVAWEAHSSHPMLKLAFFRERRFSIAAAAECLGVFGLLGALFLQTQFLQLDLGNSPLQSGLRILPMAATLVVSAVLAPFIARLIGVKFTAAAALAAVAGGLWQIAAASSLATTYGDVLPGLLLIGLGAGLLLPTATNSVVGSVPQGDSGMGSATNAVALQVGGRSGWR